MIRIIVLSLLFLISCKQESENPYDNFGGDFSLSSEKGVWKLSEHNGKVRILYFGFTHCPDICPMSLSKLKRELNKLSEEEREHVTPVFISVDYKRDTPDKVHKYASFFDKSFVGLTGTEAQIRDVTKRYGVFFEFTPLKDSEMDYTVDHTSRFFIIDKKGNVANSYSKVQGNEDFMAELKKLIGG